jgi:hypothetical protein
MSTENLQDQQQVAFKTNYHDDRYEDLLEEIGIESSEEDKSNIPNQAINPKSAIRAIAEKLHLLQGA